MVQPAAENTRWDKVQAAGIPSSPRATYASCGHWAALPSQNGKKNKTEVSKTN